MMKNRPLQALYEALAWAIQDFGVIFSMQLTPLPLPPVHLAVLPVNLLSPANVHATRHGPCEPCRVEAVAH